MKKLITGALAALTLVGGTAALGATAQAAPYGYGQNHGYNQSQFHNQYGQGRFQGPQRFQRGQFAPQSYRGRDRFVDYRREHLRAPPRGYGWVRGDNNQILMIALTTGLIAAIANSH